MSPDLQLAVISLSISNVNPLISLALSSMLKSCSKTCLMSVPINESIPSSVSVDVPNTFLMSLIPVIDCCKFKNSLF